jgi:hypothetical protein
MLRREEKIFLNIIDKDTFELTNRNGDLIFNGSDSYFIYFKNANFKTNGVIEGKYLGEASDSIIDGFCKNVSFEDGLGFKTDKKIVRTARMVAVDNKNKSVIIIEN